MSKIDGTNLKRIPVKYIRDKAKSAYKKSSECRICATKDNLELHHYSSVDMLWEKWLKSNNKQVESIDDILSLRDIFIEEHRVQLYDEVVTLCASHHDKLHSLYGKAPLLATASKQQAWVEIQRSKNVAV